jgi:hypothetical protein
MCAHAPPLLAPAEVGLEDLRLPPDLSFDRLQISDPRLYFEGAHGALPAHADGAGQQQQKGQEQGGQQRQGTKRPAAAAAAAAEALRRFDPQRLQDPAQDPSVAQQASGPAWARGLGRARPILAGGAGREQCERTAKAGKAAGPRAGVAGPGAANHRRAPPRAAARVPPPPRRAQVLLELSGGAGALGGLGEGGRPLRHPRTAIPGWEEELRKHGMVVNELLRHFWGCIPCNSDAKRRKMDKVLVGRRAGAVAGAAAPAHWRWPRTTPHAARWSQPQAALVRRIASSSAPLQALLEPPAAARPLSLAKPCRSKWTSPTPI